MFLLHISIFSRLPLLNGSPDLLLLSIAAWSLNEKVRFGFIWAMMCGIIMGVVSAIPVYVPIIGYGFTFIICKFLTKRIWQAPILAMLGTVFIGSLGMGFLSFLVLQISGSLLPLMDSVNLIIMPSTLYNVILSIPVFLIIRDFSQWVYPVEFEL